MATSDHGVLIMKNGDPLTFRISVATEIAPGHPAKRHIEESLRATLAPLPGEWHANIVCSRTSLWWLLRVVGPHFEWAALLDDPSKQEAAAITARLLHALRCSKALN